VDSGVRITCPIPGSQAGMEMRISSGALVFTYFELYPEWLIPPGAGTASQTRPLRVRSLHGTVPQCFQTLRASVIELHA